MSQTDRRTLSVQILPMSVPNPPPVGGASPSLATWGALANTETSTLPSLCLCPGEVGELLVRLVHQGDRPLHYGLQINGTIPPSWYRFYTEGSELQPNQATEAGVRFQPEANFFEARQVVQPEQTLNLDYPAELRVQGLATPDSSATSAGDQSGLLASKPFYLFLRPRSLYPQFLPAVYQEVDFIGRLLKVFEQSFEPAVPIIGGGVQRIQLNQIKLMPGFDPKPLIQELLRTSENDKPALYAELGIWQDAVTTLIDLRQKQPNNQELKDDWRSLLEDAQIGDLTNSPILGVQ